MHAKAFAGGSQISWRPFLVCANEECGDFSSIWGIFESSSYAESVCMNAKDPDAVRGRSTLNLKLFRTKSEARAFDYVVSVRQRSTLNA